MPCPHCDAEVELLDRFCRSCGNQLAAPAPSARSRGGAHRRVLALLIYLVLAGGSGSITYFYLHQGQEGVTGGDVALGIPRLVSLGPREGERGARLEQPPAADEPRITAERPPPQRRKAPPSTPRSGRVHPARRSKDRPSVRREAADLSVPDAAMNGFDAAASAPDLISVGGNDEKSNELDDIRAKINADSIQMIVKHYLPQVRACYDRAMKQQDRISGTVEVRFRITAQGRVGASKVHRNTTRHEGLGKCLAVIIQRWRFPKPAGGEAEFIYPFVFSSGE